MSFDLYDHEYYNPDEDPIISLKKELIKNKDLGCLKCYNELVFSYDLNVSTDVLLRFECSNCKSVYMVNVYFMQVRIDFGSKLHELVKCGVSSPLNRIKKALKRRLW